MKQTGTGQVKQIGIGQAFRANFLGQAPNWYKTTILAFLVLNPILMLTLGKYVTGWVLIVEFIFTLAMALKCYPLPAGGLLAIEAVVIGLTNPHSIYHEVELNLPVILLLMFMVAGIYFMKEGLVYLFTKILTKVRSKVALAFLFSILGAVLSAFLDALTVTAVIIAVAYGFYNIFHKFASSEKVYETYDINHDHIVDDIYQEDLNQFRGFLRNLMMHGAVGTALGGATTLVGEPQNLLIGSIMKWDFVDFFLNSAPVSIPVLIAGLLTAITLEVTKFWGYGYQLPDSVRKVMEDDTKAKDAALDTRGRIRLIIMAVCGVLLIFSLALHLAEVGIIGLMIIILLTSFNGVIEEGRIGHAFEEAMPFTALLIVFFSIVAVIHDQHLFTPIVHWVLQLEGQDQLVAFFAANGVLSAISDNVFVATVYMTETQKAFEAGGIALEHYNKMAVAINMGTNIPSVATPNGQAAFLFLLTSALAPLIRLSYLEMVKLALPYTIVMSLTGVLATMYLL
ncbi:sodium/proton antiporter NhaB [Desulfosporosinus youngiae]|uniref:Na+/H+ antiporter n=1 Tax=Desulfosporosinus youngiae DSM 17734 TaxID=768710 RepID=H5XS37_9FIRM|nr:sodium/proton antiporter NhaB [Desulfosporosinus youngiae]EHQ87649.1 Na+/H+ antiporter [Desulfosporosinus youngiae DSM 17734]